MLNRVIEFSLKNRLVIVALAVLVALYGTAAAMKMPIDVLPDLNRPTVTIMTEAHGLVPEEVERQVTRPLEQVLAGATGVTRIRSASGQELSMVFVEFEWGSEIFRNRQIVQEKLQLAQSLIPPGLQPQMAPITSIMGQVQLVGVRSRSGKLDATALRAIVDIEIKPRLRSVSGVGQIVAIGGAAKELQVTLDADRMRALDVAVQDVQAAIAAANVSGAGGVLPQGAKGPLVTVPGKFKSAVDLENAVVRADPERPILLRDVADVSFGPSAVRSGEAGVNGGPGAILVVFKQPGFDTVELTRRVNAELAAMAGSLDPDVEIVNDIFQQSAFIERSVENVEDAVRDGAILVVIVLFLFLLNVRTTLITLTALPLSVAITAIIFHMLGLTINTMTLGGLAVAIGALVDDAVVDVENVFRRLRENAASPFPRSTLSVVFRASSEVRNPILIGTLLVVVVYIPLFFLSGMEGRLFAPVGLAYILSTLASLVVSLTLTPALCSFLLGGKFALRHQGDGRLVQFLKGIVGRAIRFSMDHTRTLTALLAASVLACGTILATRGTEFLPAFNEGTVQVGLFLPPDVGLATSDAYGARMEKVVASVEGVRNVGRRTGRAEGDEHAEGVNVTEAIVTFDPESKRPREEVVEEIRNRLAEEFPGVASEVEQPLSHMLSHVLSGVNAQVAIKVFGPDLEILRGTAKEIEAAMKPIAGVRDLRVEPQILVDQVEVVPDREKLARAGLTVEEIAGAVELAMAGEEIARMADGAASWPVVMRLRQKDRGDLSAIRALAVRSPSGGLTKLGDVANVRISSTASNVNRENGSRRIVVQHNVAGRPLGEVVADVEKALIPIREKLAKTPGYSIRIGGQFEAQAEAERLIGILSIVAFAAMALILYAHFRSLTLASQVLLAIPAAFVGATIYIVASGQTMSVATLVGLISLGGISARNAILQVDHYLHLMKEEGEAFSREMIVRGGQERMVPLLMTALCSGIALIPLALSPDKPGRELLYPVATVIIGGLISSTLMEYLLCPGVFWSTCRAAATRLASRRDAPTPDPFQEVPLVNPPAAPHTSPANSEGESDASMDPGVARGGGSDADPAFGS